jgi:hypothetical protein
MSVSMRSALFILAAFLLLPGQAIAQGNSTAIYPAVSSSEDYISPLKRLQERDAATRATLVAALTEQQLGRGYPPQAALILTGLDSEELAIVALHRGALATQFQARAYVNQLAPSLRNLPMVIAGEVTPQHGTLDLLKLFGFRRITVSDGETFSLRINIF